MSTAADTSTRPPEGLAPGAVDLARATVAVLGGGRSSEREVSLVTLAAVAEALRDRADGRGPARVLTVEIQADGRWSAGGEALPPGRALEALGPVDVFFLALHGGEGEDGTLQGFLDVCDRAYTGSGVRGSAVAMDKLFARELAASAGERIAPAVCVRRGPEALARARTVHVEGTGSFVKPRCGGSSVGASWVRAAADLDAALALALEEEDEVLVETAVAGTEVTVGVLAEPGGGLRALTPVEIRPHAGTFFDYREKYDAGGAVELCPPESVPPAVQDDLRERALRLHRALACEGYSRTDFVLPTAGGAPVFLETNTLPGLTGRSLLPLAAAADGIDYRALCLAIAADGLARGARRARLR